MKKILLLFLISTLFIKCNSDEPETEQNQNEVSLFAFKENELPNSTFINKFIKINQINGNETTILDFGTDEYVETLAYNEASDEILSVGDNNKLYKIKTETGTFSTINLDNNGNIVYTLIIGKNNELFAFKENELPNSTFINKFIKIDQTNGNETTVFEFGANEYIESLTFNKETNEILSVGDNNKLYKINTDTGTFTTVNLDNNGNIVYTLIIGKNNELFAFKENELPNSTFINKFIKIDQTNGNETTVFEFGANEYIESLAFNKETNEILSVGDNNKLYKINTDTGTFTTISLDNNGNIIYHLVTK